MSDAYTAVETAAGEDTTEPIVSVENLSVSLGGTAVLRDVSIDVPEGRLVGLIGPNGAGKTTLLRAINGTVSIDSGRVTVAGVDAATCSSRRLARLVATVPQTTTLSFGFSVRETIEMGRHPHVSRFGAMDDTDVAAVDSAMAATAVESLADRPITDVSGGERQRVLLARALAQETPVLVLDEPTANLDINHAARTLELVRDAVTSGALSGRAAIAAIHDLDLAARYCDELVLLADGEINAYGPPEAVLSAESIGSAFDTEVSIGTDPVTATERVVPRATVPADDTAADRSVHVLGSGALAREAIACLAEAGCSGSVGPIPAGDIAAETARLNGFGVVDAPAFETLSRTVKKRVRSRCQTADVVVVTGPIDPWKERIVCDLDCATIGVVREPPRSEEGATGSNAAYVDHKCSIEELLGKLADRTSG